MSVEKILESNEEMCRKLGHLSMDQGHGQNGTHDSKAFAQCKRVVIACDTIEWKYVLCVVVQRRLRQGCGRFVTG